MKIILECDPNDLNASCVFEKEGQQVIWQELEYSEKTQVVMTLASMFTLFNRGVEDFKTEEK